MRNLFRKGSSSEESQGSAEGASGTILIVDDSATERHILKGILQKAGYQVEIATDGQQGLEEAQRLRPDLILMDVVMPVLNGFQATRKLRDNEETANIPVIMVTTKDQETDRNWGLRQGAEVYLVKPVSAPELLARVKELLGG